MTLARLAVQRGVFVRASSFKPHGLDEFSSGVENKKCIVNNTGTTWMKAMTLMAALAAVSVFSQSAHAREHYHRHSAAHAPRYFDSAPTAAESWGASWTAASDSNFDNHVASGRGGRPRAWCGW